MSERGRWVKGQSGNSKGRPTAERALAKVLSATGEHKSFGDVSNKAQLARMIWEGLTWGKVTFAGGNTLELTVIEWLELVKWVHAHVDGTYQPEEEAPKFRPPQYVYGPEELTNLFQKRLDECDGDIMRLWEEEGAAEISGEEAVN